MSEKQGCTVAVLAWATLLTAQAVNILTPKHPSLPFCLISQNKLGQKALLEFIWQDANEKICNAQIVSSLSYIQCHNKDMA